MADKTLLLGNGLYRTQKDGISWAELMAHLGSHQAEGANVPFPIEFEQIAATRGCTVGRRTQDPYKELRSDIAREITQSESQPSSIYKRYGNLPFQHMVTTNYDQTFEAMFQNVTVEVSNPGSSRNLLGPVGRCDSADFYHAHGLAKWKNTLCLGHEHYAALIGKIRKEFYPIDEDENDFLQKLITEKVASLKIWPEYMLTNSVAIVGFGMDYSESDFWWLLALRAALFAPCNNLMEFENEIVYYKAEINGKPLSLQESSHLDALQALGVRIERVPAKTYPDAYEKIACLIEKSWSKQ